MKVRVAAAALGPYRRSGPVDQDTKAIEPAARSDEPDGILQNAKKGRNAPLGLCYRQSQISPFGLTCRLCLT